MEKNFNRATLVGVLLLILLSACSPAAQTNTPEPVRNTPTAQSGASGTDVGAQPETPQATATPFLGELVETRAPGPTATPGPLALAIAEYTYQVGLAANKFLGISVADWINLGVSIVYILVGYLVGTWVIRRLLPRLVRRTPTTFDDQLLEKIGDGVRWLVVLFILGLSTERLTFVSATVKIFLNDIYFIFGLVLVVQALFKITDLSAAWYTAYSVQEGHSDMAQVIKMITRLGRIIIGAIGLTILLSHFGVNVTALTAALGIGGLAISLAAKDTVSDAIAGVILMVDRPFRVGDRIEIQGADTWGDVTDIGLRTTRIRTRDNRMVIVPNSIISQSQVINYSYPDPRYRIETHVDVAFGTDIETVRKLFVETVSQVEGVLLDKPVDALYIDMSGGAMRFRLRWWIESYVDTRRMYDRVHTAVQHALDKAGIVSPNIAENINLQVGEQTTERLSLTFGAREPDGDPSGTGSPDADVESVK